MCNSRRPYPRGMAMLCSTAMSNRVMSALVVLLSVVFTAERCAKSGPASEVACTPAGSLMTVAGLTEASGLVASRATPGRLWSHNDSGRPEIIALDTKGQVAGRVSVSGATVVDWEAVAAGRCDDGTCLYLADIGDNRGVRKDITIYRIAEPPPTAGSVQVEATFRASYPDGGHDAEALLAAPDGRLYIMTKGDTGHVSLYRFPAQLRTGTIMQLERVGAPLSKDQPAADARITDGAISPDGEWVVLRTKAALIFYRASEFLEGEFKEAGRVDLTPLGEPQGEAVAFGPSDTVYLAGEGGGESESGTLAVLTCSR